MAATGTLEVPGLSGEQYKYSIYPIGTEFNVNPGNYIFTKPVGEGKQTLIYVGQTGDLSERFDNHHKMPCIKRNEAINICIHISSADEKIRMSEESDIVNKWHPICNG